MPVDIKISTTKTACGCVTQRSSGRTTNAEGTVSWDDSKVFPCEDHASEVESQPTGEEVGTQ